MKVNLFVEFNGKKIDDKFLLEKAKEFWKESGKKVKDLVSVDLYYKPEESRCYYVFNGEENGSFDVN